MVKYILEKEEISSEKILYPSVDIFDSGGATLQVKNGRGERWDIAKLTREGQLYLYSGLCSSIGLEVNTEGRIIVVM